MSIIIVYLLVLINAINGARSRNARQIWRAESEIAGLFIQEQLLVTSIDRKWFEQEETRLQ